MFRVGIKISNTEKNTWGLISSKLVILYGKLNKFNRLMDILCG